MKISGSPLYQVFLGDVPAVQVSRHAGAFPEKTSGGLLGEIGADLIRRRLGWERLPLPFKLSARFSRSLEPGGRFTAEFEGDERKPSVKLFATDGKGVTVTLEHVPDSHPPDRQEILRTESGRFHCIDSCVGFGKSNPEGFHRKLHYHLSEEGRPVSHLWTPLASDQQVLGAQLAAGDELTWWKLAAHFDLGVTPFYEITVWHEPDPVDPAVVDVAEPVGLKKRIMSLGAVVSNQSRVLSKASFGFMINREQATAGMGGIVDELEWRLRILRGQAA